MPQQIKMDTDKRHTMVICEAEECLLTLPHLSLGPDIYTNLVLKPSWEGRFTWLKGKTVPPTFARRAHISACTQSRLVSLASAPSGPGISPDVGSDNHQTSLLQAHTFAGK